MITLFYRGHAGHFLRKRGRRNRTVQQLQQDASNCLDKIGRSHIGFTSSLTLHEAEVALFSILRKSSKGIKDRERYVVSSSRTVVIQILTIKGLYNLQILDLTEDIVEKEVQEIDLQKRGIRSADSLHVATAMLYNAEIIITTDRHLLGLNGVFHNVNGKYIQCLDTNAANNLL